MQWFIINFLEMQQGVVRICTEREREIWNLEEEKCYCIESYVLLLFEK